MATYTENVIKKQLASGLTEEQAVLAAYAEQGGDVLMIDAMGLSIYDAADEADETGVWVFLGNAINQGSIYGDWQQNPSVSHEMPDDVALGVPSKAEQIGTGMKWLIGSLSVASLLALGASVGGGSGGGDNETPDFAESNAAPAAANAPTASAASPIPEPRALVQQFSAAENPHNPEQRASVVQAELPPEPTPELANEPVLPNMQQTLTQYAMMMPNVLTLDENPNPDAALTTLPEKTSAHYESVDSAIHLTEWLNLSAPSTEQVV